MGDPGLSKQGYSFLPRSKYLAVVAVVALCLSLVELIDFIELPFEAGFGQGVATGSMLSTSVVNSLVGTGYGGLFVLMAMESASLPIPSELVLPVAGYSVFLGKMNLWLAVIDATAAGLLGALVDYYLALWLGRPVIYRLMAKFGISSKHLDDGERWVDSRGSWTIFIGRLLPGVRSIISVPAGLLRMKLATFSLLTLAGAFIWSAALIYIGYSAGPLWQSSLAAFSRVAGEAVLGAVAVLSFLYVAYYLGAFGRRR